MVWSVLRVRARVRVWCLSRFMVPMWFSVEIGSGCDVRMSARFCVRFRNWWADTKLKVRCPEYGKMLGLRLSFQ